eukprot:745507_1
MPISFQIKISVTVDDVEYFSKLSDIITVDYLKLKPGMRTIIVEDTDMQMAQYHVQVVAINQGDITLRFDAPKAETRTPYYVHIVGQETENRLARMVLKKNTDHAVEDVDIEDARDFAKNNTISISVYSQQHGANGLVSPLNIQLPIADNDYTTTFKPETVSVRSIQAIKHGDHVYVYWQHPLSSFGSIKYKVMLHADDDHETQEVTVLPYKIPLSKLPVRVQIAVIFTIQLEEDDEVKVYESPFTEPVLMTTKSAAKGSAKPLTPRRDTHVFDGEEREPYFAQITQVTNQTFVVRLDVIKTNDTKKRKYDVKEIAKPNAEELERLIVPPKALFGSKKVYFDDDHDDKYALGVFDRTKDDPQLLSNSIDVVAYPSDATYPPTPQYKPQAIDVSTIKKILDKEHQTVYLYWNVPILSFGDIEYKIVYNPHDDAKDNDTDDVKDDIVSILPHSIPLKLVPIQIQIITISKFDKATFYSQPSATIDIGNVPKSTSTKPKPPVVRDDTTHTVLPVEIKWDDMPTYFMQIVSVDQEEFSIKLIPNKTDAQKRKFMIRDTVQSNVKKQIKINKSKDSGATDIRIDEGHDAVYQLALF